MLHAHTRSSAVFIGVECRAENHDAAAPALGHRAYEVLTSPH